jgi:surface protein
MTDDQICEEFDKWLVKNEDMINKYVTDHKEEIDQMIEEGRKRAVNEGVFDTWEDDDEGGDDDESPKPISGEVVRKEEVDEDEPEQIRSSITGAVKLTNKMDDKYNIFGIINDFYDMIHKEKTNMEPHTSIMRKLDVSDIYNMNALFAFADVPNLDLSSWDTGKVKHMEGMFYKSTFNNDSICNWNVSSCADFKNMFLFSSFNQSLKKWTPAFIEKDFVDEDGKPEVRTVRADLPIVGGTEDEERAMVQTFRRNLFKTMREEDEEAEAVKENKMIHVIDYDSFVNEGKFKDFIDKGIKKVKNFFKSISLKIGNLIAFFREDGSILPAVSAYTALNVAASGEIPGVHAFCACDNDLLNNVPSEASIVPEPGYYGIVDKNSLEYRNYLTFTSMINEHYEKYGNTGALLLNEDENFKRVGFSAEEGGVEDAVDINSEDLIEILQDLIANAPAYRDKNDDREGGVVFVWGAPGIGKSTIPKAVVKAWNKKKGDEFHQKALLTIQCGDLTIDGFSLPIPVEKSISEYLDERPNLKQKVDKRGIPADELEKIKRNMHKISTEAPKMWLPAFKKSATQEEMKVLDDIANGYMDISIKNGEVVKTETTEGGILLFDEFFRAEENIFKILMQLILNREYSGYVLGTKWGCLCCSNRPNDDEEVATKFEKTGAVVGTRMLAGAYNFIPSFDEWKKWAVDEGGFDDVTLEFLMKDTDPRNGEYTNWHTIRPDQYTQRGKTAWPTPRTWSGLMNELHLYCSNHGYSSIYEIPERKLRQKADAIIGKEMGERYVDFFIHRAAMVAVQPKEVLDNPSYKIPSDSKCADVCRQIFHYVKIKFDKTERPTVAQLVNLFNNLNNTYTGTKDNFVKKLHLDIIKHLDLVSSKEVRSMYMEYLDLADKRFHYDKADFR